MRKAKVFKEGVIGAMFLRLFTPALFMLALAASAFFTFAFLSRPIVEAHGFRQAQTALTAYYLIKNGFSLAYWTPVLGQGWSVPFEFPIYQQLVAWATEIFGAPLTDTGRAVSWLMTALCCVPVYFTLREMGVEKETRFYALALFMSAPLYLFWAGTFMIESTALFFTLCFAFYGVKIIERKAGAADYVLAGIFLTLGLLQKITTGLPVVGIFGLFFLWTACRPNLKNNIGYIVKTGVMILISFAIAYAWLKFSDRVKMENPLGAKLTSAVLGDWNLGKWEQRFSLHLWGEVIGNRLFLKNLGGPIGALALGAGLFLARKTKAYWPILAALAAGFLPLLMFTNLHIVHTYYQTANAVFLLIALALSIAVIGEQLFGRWPAVKAAFLAVFVIVNLSVFAFAEDGLKLKAGPTEVTEAHFLRTAAFVKAHTQPDDIVVWYGFDWTSVPAFYSERKSLTPADWMESSVDVIEHREKYLRTPPRAFMLCPAAVDADKIRAALTAKFGAMKPEMIDGCEFYLISGAG